MKNKLIYFTKNDTPKKKIIIVVLWIFAILFSLYLLYFLVRIERIFHMNIVQSESEIFLIISFLLFIGLLFRVQIARLISLAITYLSLGMTLAIYIEESLSLYTRGSCISIFLGYGIDGTIIYPEVILHFFGIFFGITLVFVAIIYIFSNNVSLELFSISKKTYIKEIKLFISMSIIMFIGSLWLLMEQKTMLQTKAQEDTIINNLQRPIKTQNLSIPPQSWL